MDVEFVIGSPVRGSDLLFREAFVEDLWESLKRNNVLLLAPRRMGKTSVMYRLLDQPRFDFQVVHLNAEPIDEPKTFFLYLIDAMQKHQPALLHRLAKSVAFFGKLADKVESLNFGELKVALRKSGIMEKDWRDIAKAFFDSLQASREKILISIDEFPDMIAAMSHKHEGEVAPFLHLLRAYRIHHESETRWLFAGSVNLKGALERMKLLATINDLADEKLPPFTGAQVEIFIDNAMSQRGVPIEVDLIPRVKELLGEPIPFFLQLLTKELYRYWRDQNLERLSALSAEEVFNQAILGEVSRDKLQHYRSRISIYYPENRKNIACALLDKLSVSGVGLRRETLFLHFREHLAQQGENLSELEARSEFDYLLTLLQSDFYVELNTDGRFDFVSKIIKSWWEKFYAPS